MKIPKITVEEFYVENASALGMRLLAGSGGLKRTIKEPTVNRPGLALAGFTKYFANKRIQAVGSAEVTYLKSLPKDERVARFENICRQKVPGVVFSRSLKPEVEFLEVSERMGVPVFRSPLITMKFINRATLALEDLFAPRGQEHGSMVDILGVGVVIKGESGIGKSECVLALVERGYSLVADDITKVKLIDGRVIIGTSSSVTRDHMEVRGIGIINVGAMFGVKSIRLEKQIDLVVSLVDWDKVKEVDRLGIDEQTVELLGVSVPHITIPVRPGRDMARLIEVAAFQNKLKRSGHNSAEELNRRLVESMSRKENE
ncbi:MAG: HPr(Ser) kinase/phosphatase [Verrucomicrobiota bacterium]|jgi:HPr kinase/phosphorylase|nr:HPr(Ser) kinase/phosphatase [Verrucomicrobiota bacterium]